MKPVWWQFPKFIYFRGQWMYKNSGCHLQNVVLISRQSKTKSHSIYNNTKQRKQQINTLKMLELQNIWHFVWVLHHGFSCLVTECRRFKFQSHWWTRKQELATFTKYIINKWLFNISIWPTESESIWKTFERKQWHICVCISSFIVLLRVQRSSVWR